jgi:hypothetical protein
MIFHFDTVDIGRTPAGRAIPRSVRSTGKVGHLNGHRKPAPRLAASDRPTFFGSQTHTYTRARARTHAITFYLPTFSRTVGHHQYWSGSPVSDLTSDLLRGRTP